MSTAIANVAEVLHARKLSGFQKGVIFLCSAIVFVEGMNAQAAGYVAPELRQAWGLTPSQLTMFITSGLFGLMFGGLLVAPLADRIGRRPVLIACVALFGICSIATAASTSIAMLVGARFLTGLGIGGAMANAISLTAEYSPHARRSSMIAIMLIGFILGAIIAGLVAAGLVSSFGWESVFIFTGVLPLMLVPVLVFALPESIRFLLLRDDSRETVSRLLRRIDPTLNIDHATRLVVEEKAIPGISVFALFGDGRARTTVLLWIIYFMSLLNLYLFTSWLTTHTRALGISVALGIIVGTMYQVGGIFGSVFGWMLDRVGPSRTIFTAYLFAAVCIGCIGLAGSNLVMLMLAVFGAGFGIIGGQSSTNALAAMTYPTQIRATGVGWATGIGRVGSIVGPGVAGMLLEMQFSTQHVFFLAIFPALFAAAAGSLLGRSPRLLAAKA